MVVSRNSDTLGICNETMVSRHHQQNVEEYPQPSPRRREFENIDWRWQ
jgi:hypothetical protein